MVVVAAPAANAEAGCESGGQHCHPENRTCKQTEDGRLNSSRSCTAGSASSGRQRQAEPSEGRSGELSTPNDAAHRVSAK